MSTLILLLAPFPRGYTALTLKFLHVPKRMMSSFSSGRYDWLPDVANSYGLSRLSVEVTSSRKSSQSPNAGLGVSPAFLQHPVPTDTPTPFTLTFTCPSASTEHKPPQEQGQELFTARCAQSWGWQVLHSCWLNRWMKYSKTVSSSSETQREGNSQYQYLRDNNFTREKGKYFIFKTSVTTGTQETVSYHDLLQTKKEERQTDLANSRSESEDKRKWKSS